MTPSAPLPTPADHTTLPEPWLGEMAAHKNNQDSVIAYLDTDLDESLRFHSGVVILTEFQILSKSLDGEWRQWELRPGLVLEHRDHAGVGTLALSDADRLLARWHHTLGRDTAVRRLTERFQEHIKAVTENREPPPPGGCSLPDL